MKKQNLLFEFYTNKFIILGYFVFSIITHIFYNYILFSGHSPVFLLLVIPNIVMMLILLVAHVYKNINKRIYAYFITILLVPFEIWLSFYVSGNQNKLYFIPQVVFLVLLIGYLIVLDLKNKPFNAIIKLAFIVCFASEFVFVIVIPMVEHALTLNMGSVTYGIVLVTFYFLNTCIRVAFLMAVIFINTKQQVVREPNSEAPERLGEELS